MAQERADAFLKVAQTPGTKVIDRIDEMHRQQVLENRKRLMPIVKTVILCGRLGISMRGHRGAGSLDPEQAMRAI